MTDIVERLLEPVDYLPREVRQEAAAEIERLGALATVVREQGFEIEQLRADNERLLAALRLMDEFAWSAVVADCEEARIGLNERLAAVRAALEPKP